MYFLKLFTYTGAREVKNYQKSIRPKGGLNPRGRPRLADPENFARADARVYGGLKSARAGARVYGVLKFARAARAGEYTLDIFHF